MHPGISWYDPSDIFRPTAHLQQPGSDIHRCFAAAQDNVALVPGRGNRQQVGRYELTPSATRRRGCASRAPATHLLASGIHPKVASERLGHSKIGITLDLYSHVLPGMQEDAAERVDAGTTGCNKQALERHWVAKR